MRIGIIDSGIGGITTMMEVASRVKADYFYYMDNMNVPYGIKSRDNLIEIGERIMGELLDAHVDMVIIACNTLSSCAGEYLRRKVSVPIICIEPSVKPAMRAGGNTIVMATPSTIKSEKFARLIAPYKGLKCVPSAHLASFIENGDTLKAMAEIDHILDHSNAVNVVLGCTHYVYMRRYIAGKGYRTFDGNEGVAKQVKRVMTLRNIANDSTYNTFHLHATAMADMDRIARLIGEGVMYF